MSKKFFSLIVLFTTIFSLNLLAQSNYERLLKEIQRNDPNVYYRYEQNELIINYSSGMQSVKMVVKDFEIDSKNKIKIGVLLAPVYILPENYSPSKNLLFLISQLNNQCSPGVILLIDEFKIISYVSYFWPDELTKNTFANEIKLAAGNAAYSKEQITSILNNESKR